MAYFSSISFILEKGFVGEADFFISYFTLGIDDEGHRDRIPGHVVSDKLHGVHDNWIVDLILFHEFKDFCCTFIINRDADDFQSFVFILCVGVYKIRDFPYAGRAPGCP